MTDLEKLDEALEKLDRTGSAYGNVELLADAARAYRNLVANGERVEWCETHGDRAYISPSACHTGVDTGDYGDCSIVSRLLVDPPKEEER